MAQKIFLTGLPRSGKTTLLHRLIDPVAQKTGFLTDEIRENGERVGFKVVTSHGEESVLADVSTPSPFKVSRYYVHPSSLETVIEPLFAFGRSDLLYLDEIGQMELFSSKFKELVEAYLDSDQPLIATISKIYSDAFTEALLRRNDVTVFEITPENREAIFAEISATLAPVL